MTKDDAMELIERIPFITTSFLTIANESIRFEMFNSILQSDDPVEWVRLIKNDYLRRNDENYRKHPNEAETAIALKVKDKLDYQLADALDIKQSQVEAFIARHIDESW